MRVQPPSEAEALCFINLRGRWPEGQLYQNRRMRIHPAWLREFVEVAADNRRLTQEFLPDNAGDKTSAVGAKGLS